MALLEDLDIDCFEAIETKAEKIRVLEFNHEKVTGVKARVTGYCRADGDVDSRCTRDKDYDGCVSDCCLSDRPKSKCEHWVKLR